MHAHARLFQHSCAQKLGRIYTFVVAQMSIGVTSLEDSLGHALFTVRSRSAQDASSFACALQVISYSNRSFVTALSLCFSPVVGGVSILVS